MALNVSDANPKEKGDNKAVIGLLKKQLDEKNLHFTKKPILIGGMAMEYYGLRKSGADIDLVICDEDYQALALAYPDKRKDLWADLGVMLEPLEIWRSIKLLDYVSIPVTFGHRFQYHSATSSGDSRPRVPKSFGQGFR